MRSVEADSASSAARIGSFATGSPFAIVELLLPVLGMPPRAEASPSTSSTPLTRHHDRLHDTATRLAARRDEAQAAGAPAATIRALDAHVERVEQRIAALAVMPRAGLADLGASREPISPHSAP